MKKLISVILIAAMLFALAVPAMALGFKPSYRDYGTYMCVGDSIAAGTCMTRNSKECEFDQNIPEEQVWGVWDDDFIYRGYNFERVHTAYHALIQDDLAAALGHEVKLIQGARAGFRAVEFRYLLDGVYNDFDETRSWGNTYFHYTNEFDSDFCMEDLDDLNRQMAAGQQGRCDDYFTFENIVSTRTDNVDVTGYVDAVSKSDLISLNFGSNDVFSYAFGVIMGALGQEYTIPGLSEIADQYRESGDLGAAFAKLVDVCETVGSIATLLQTTVATFDAVLDQYEENYTAIVNKLYEINPDIDIIGFSCYNPMNYFRISGDSEFNLDAILSSVLLRLNGFIESFSAKHAGHFFYADVNGTETYSMSLDDRLMWEYFSFKVHPTLAGHRYMADQALRAINCNSFNIFGTGNVHYVRLLEQLVKNTTNNIIVLFTKLLGSGFVFGPVSFGK